MEAASPGCCSLCHRHGQPEPLGEAICLAPVGCSFRCPPGGMGKDFAGGESKNPSNKVALVFSALPTLSTLNRTNSCTGQTVIPGSASNKDLLSSTRNLRGLKGTCFSVSSQHPPSENQTLLCVILGELYLIVTPLPVRFPDSLSIFFSVEDKSSETFQNPNNCYLAIMVFTTVTPV